MRCWSVVLYILAQLQNRQSDDLLQRGPSRFRADHRPCPKFWILFKRTPALYRMSSAPSRQPSRMHSLEASVCLPPARRPPFLSSLGHRCVPGPGIADSPPPPMTRAETESTLAHLLLNRPIKISSEGDSCHDEPFRKRTMFPGWGGGAAVSHLSQHATLPADSEAVDLGPVRYCSSLGHFPHYGCISWAVSVSGIHNAHFHCVSRAVKWEMLCLTAFYWNGCQNADRKLQTMSSISNCWLHFTNTMWIKLTGL